MEDHQISFHHYYTAYAIIEVFSNCLGLPGKVKMINHFQCTAEDSQSLESVLRLSCALTNKLMHSPKCLWTAGPWLDDPT